MNVEFCLLKDDQIVEKEFSGTRYLKGGLLGYLTTLVSLKSEKLEVLWIS